MNKKDLISVVTEKTGKTKKDVDTILGVIFDEIGNALINGDDVSITGFGKFTVGTRSAREGRNPKDGSVIMIPESKNVKFKVSSVLKSIINE